MAIRVHGLPMSTNTARVLTCLEEKEVTYEIIPVDTRSGVHKQMPFISLNPFGKIPAVEDGNVTLFESRAITRYMAIKYKDSGPDLLRHSSLSDSAMVNVWLEVEAQQFNPAISPLVFELLIKPLIGSGVDAQAVEDQAEKLGRVLDVYEARLSESKYLAGDCFTLADLHHCPCTFYLLKTSKACLITSRPHVLAWWEDISSRPAWKKTAKGMTFASTLR